MMRVYSRLFSLSAFVVLSACFAFQIFAQNEEVKRSFKEWSKKDAENVLNDSNWARKQAVKINFGGQTRIVAGGPNPVSAQGALLANEQNTASLGGAQAPVDFTFTLRLRSALPVRQALLRLKQIEANYDKMSAKNRAEFDATNKGLLECPACAQNYVLTLAASSKEEPGADPVFTTFKGARLDDIKRYIFLADENGNRRQLIHFVPPKSPGDEAIFFFPRLDEKGEPLLTPKTKELIFNVTDTQVNLVTNFRINVSDLLVNGAVEF